MLEAGHKLRVGQVGLVGAATGSGQPQVALDVDADPAHYKNPLLPNTRSEMALPLRVGERVIGALDVQSQEVEAFDENDITVLQTMADQLAVAIENARLIQQLNQSLKELEKAHEASTYQAWQTFTGSRKKPLGYRYQQARSGALASGSLSEIHQAPEEPEFMQAIQQGQIVAGAPTDQATLAVPIKLRNQVIGALHLRFASKSISPEMVSLVEEASARLALILESTRLLSEAQRLAAREQQINWIASQVRDSVNMENILQNTVRELGRALGASRTFIQIGSQPWSGNIPPDEHQPGDPNSHQSSHDFSSHGNNGKGDSFSPEGEEES